MLLFELILIFVAMPDTNSFFPPGALERYHGLRTLEVHPLKLHHLYVIAPCV